jgi:hypothetical protein
MFDRDIQDDMIARNEMELSRDLIKCDICDCIFPSGDAIIARTFSDTIDRSVFCPDCFLGDHDNDHCDDSMDGDMESGLASAGWGTDEDYGDCGDYDDCF